MAQQINVADLDAPQLLDVKRQLDQELEHLTSSFGQLKQAQGKFNTCAENVKQLATSSGDTPILVPLTNSLYVPGRITDKNNVIVDVGTGYFVKKSTAEATTHYKGKVDFVTKNLESLQQVIQKKQENLNYLVTILQAKLAESKDSKSTS
ncbi:subunit of tubulin prefoldin [Serendipita sp. 401]|nr:subunit of tubulin prefoldin [Serendipita sp. 397]KAG8828802.1 subunit of tubulin prefoldin [Serendipita sp. 401]KAG8876514.1 subunit of tubulin prefoldin [Serendipita sp. 405]KAG9058676.1 subunit of tubulin prefoldin [Serendipita sp. 407]